MATKQFCEFINKIEDAFLKGIVAGVSSLRNVGAVDVVIELAVFVVKLPSLIFAMVGHWLSIKNIVAQSVGGIRIIGRIVNHVRVTRTSEDTSHDC